MNLKLVCLVSFQGRRRRGRAHQYKACEHHHWPGPQRADSGPTGIPRAAPSPQLPMEKEFGFSTGDKGASGQTRAEPPQTLRGRPLVYCCGSARARHQHIAQRGGASVATEGSLDPTSTATPGVEGETSSRAESGWLPCAAVVVRGLRPFLELFVNHTNLAALISGTGLK